MAFWPSFLFGQNAVFYKGDGFQLCVSTSPRKREYITPFLGVQVLVKAIKLIRYHRSQF